MAVNKILIVDDEVDYVNMMKIRLESRGCVVMVANNGKDALDIVEKEKPDTVLLDIMMPELDGLSVLKQIRSRNAALPVFLMTGFSNEAKKLIAANLNASGYIVKGEQDLDKEIENMIDITEIIDKHRPHHD